MVTSSPPHGSRLVLGATERGAPKDDPAPHFAPRSKAKLLPPLFLRERDAIKPKACPGGNQPLTQGRQGTVLLEFRLCPLTAFPGAVEKEFLV